MHGIRIIDLTAMASGPYATCILADQGADVIKIEPPGKGDLIRHIGTTRGGMSAIFNTLNRGKRSVVLDLREPRGAELLRELAVRADVLIQNFRPGVVDRLGIGEAALRELAPDLIYVSISGFGERGPSSQRRVYDSVMQAYSGIAGQQANPETGVPEFVRNVICDKGTALTTAQTITAALFARERGAGGQHLKISMLHACIAFLWPDGMQNYTYVSGESPPTGPPSLPAIRKTADGFMTITAIKDQEYAALCRALDQPDLIDDPRFAEAGNRAHNASALHEVISPITEVLSTAELAERLEAEEVPYAVVAMPASIHEDPQVVANELLVETDHPTAGRMRNPRPVGDFDRTPSEISRPAPCLGEHTDEVLTELGLAAAELADLRAQGIVE